jgi:hypothetical protein
MRRHTAALAAILLLSTACSQDEVDLAPDSASAEPVAAETVAADRPDVEELLEEYGELLAAAAVTGGDALERTLTRQGRCRSPAGRVFCRWEVWDDGSW